MVYVILSGIFSVAAAQELQAILDSAHAHHEAFQKRIEDMLIVREATIFSEDGDQHILFKKLSKGIKTREETITELSDTTGLSEELRGPIRVIELFDGKSSWQFNALNGKTKIGNGMNRQDSPIVEYWIDPPLGSKILGSEVMHDRDCWIIESEPTEGYNYSRVWLDKEYHLMIRAESWNELHEPTVIENTCLWLVLDNFAIPSRTTIKKRWQPSMELVLKELKINSGLPDSLFSADNLP
jgi:outer membrane lipoprotein-sorting protein